MNLGTREVAPITSHCLFQILYQVLSNSLLELFRPNVVVEVDDLLVQTNPQLATELFSPSNIHASMRAYMNLSGDLGGAHRNAMFLVPEWSNRTQGHPSSFGLHSHAATTEPLAGFVVAFLSWP
jgi:hypothetical protein